MPFERTFRRKLWWAGLAAAIPCASVAMLTDARAEFTVCNQTLDVVNLAIGQEKAEDFETEGWWTIGVNRCVDVITEPLANRYIYVFAKDVFGQPILSGTTQMCVGPRRFTLQGIGACWERGHEAVPFYEVDTKAVERWTFFLQPSPGQ